MAITIKSLANGQLTSTSDTNLYPPADFTTKPVVIRNMRFVNTSSSASATLTLKIKQDSTSLSRLICPVAITIPPKALCIIDEEITLEGSAADGFAILGATSSGGAIDYVLSGFERDA